MSSKPENIKIEETPIREVDDRVDIVPVIESYVSVNTELLARLQDSGDIEIPGLDIKNILQNIMNTRKDIQNTLNEYKKIIEDKTLPETIRSAAQQSMNNTIKSYENELKPQIQESVTTIKKCYKEIKDGVTNIKESITTMVTNIMLPKCIGTVTPNPVTAMVESKVFKQQVHSECNRLTSTAIEMVKAADKISYKIPSSVETVLVSISSIGKMLDKMPI